MTVHDQDELPRIPAAVAMYRAALALNAGDPAGCLAHAAVEGLTRAGHIADVLGCSLTLADLELTLGHLGVRSAPGSTPSSRPAGTSRRAPS